MTTLDKLRSLRRERKLLVRRMKRTQYVSTYANLSAEHDSLTARIQEMKALLKDSG